MCDKDRKQGGEETRDTGADVATRRFADGQAVKVPSYQDRRQHAHIVRWFAEVGGDDYYLVSIDCEPVNTSAGERVLCERDLLDEEAV